MSNCIIFKRRDKTKIEKDIENTDLPIINLAVYEWMCKLLRQRFIAVRIRYVDSEFELVSILLSLRHFDRTTESESMMTSLGILHDWVKSVLNEFGISTPDIFSATTDAGSDVRNMCESFMGVEWEWCLPHLSTNAIKEACGMMY